MKIEFPNYDIKNRQELEEKIISFIVTNSYGMDLLMKNQIDNPEYFRDLFCKEAFRICLYLHEREIGIDLITVAKNRVNSLKIGDVAVTMDDFDYRLSMVIANRFVTETKMNFLIVVFKQYIVQDYWNNVSSDILQNNWDNRDIGVVSDNIIAEYEELMDKLFPKNGSTKATLLTFDEKRAKILSGEYANVPLPTTELNEFISGLMPPELSIIAARPGMAKTTMALAICANASYDKGFKGLFISLEMSVEQLINKIVMNKTGLTSTQIRTFTFTDEEFDIYKRCYAEISEHPNLIFVDQSEASTLRDIEKMIQLHKPKYVILDYLQLTSTGKAAVQNREQQISLISRTLKSFCLEYGIPIVALSQLSREVDKRTNKRPMLSDLRESGAIEQDADNVWFLYREAYYMEQRKEFVKEIEKGNIEWIIGKGRGTGIKIFQMWLDLKTLSVQEGFRYFDEPLYVIPPPPPPIDKTLPPPPP